MTGKGVNWKRGSSRLQFTTRCNKTMQSSFFLPNEKERKLCKKKRRMGERGGRGGEVFNLFQRYHKLSDCSCFSCLQFYKITALIVLKFVTVNERQAFCVKVATSAALVAKCRYVFPV